MGQTIERPGLITLRAAVAHATGQRLEWIRNGTPLGEVAIPPNGEVTYDATAAGGDWFAVVVRDQTGPTLFANPIFVSR